MPVPNTFANATATIPLSQLDANFATTITLGNTAIQLGNTVSTLNNMTLANVTVTSGNVTITNVTVTTANVTTANIANAVITTADATTANIATAIITTANVTTANIATEIVTTSQTLNYGTANGVVYLNGSKVATTGSELTYNGTTFELSKSQNTDTVIAIINNSSGTAAAAQLYLSNGTTRSQFYHTGANYITSGAITASQGGVYSAASGGLALVAENASGIIRFATQNPNTEKARISALGTLMVNTTTESSVPTPVKMLANSVSNTALQLNTGTSGGAIYSNNIGAGFRIYSYTGALGSETYTLQLSNDGAARTVALRDGTLSNGVGIAFPATQSASSDANTLDDYEEGTFTPLALGTTTGGTASYVIQVGRYTKIGNRVFYSLYINYSGGTGSGFMRVGGLPFTSNSTASNFPTASIYPGGLTLSANNVALAYVETSGTTVVINQYPVGGGTAADVNYDGTALILVSGHYEV